MIDESPLERFIRSARRVASFTGVTLFEAMQFPHDFFLLCFKEETIEEWMRTQEGRKYLKKAQRLQKTSPDYEALSRLPGYRREVIPDGSEH